MTTTTTATAAAERGNPTRGKGRARLGAAPVSPLCPTCGNFTPADDRQADINIILVRNRTARSAEPPLPLSDRLELRRKFVEDLLPIRALAAEYDISFPTAHRILRSTPMPASGAGADAAGE